MQELDQQNRELMALTGKKEETIQRLQGRMEEFIREKTALSSQLDTLRADLHHQTGELHEKAAVRERADHSRIAELQTQLSRSTATASQLRRSKEEVGCLTWLQFSPPPFFFTFIGFVPDRAQAPNSDSRPPGTPWTMPSNQEEPGELCHLSQVVLRLHFQREPRCSPQPSPVVTTDKPTSGSLSTSNCFIPTYFSRTIPISKLFPLLIFPRTRELQGIIQHYLAFAFLYWTERTWSLTEREKVQIHVHVITVHTQASQLQWATADLEILSILL